MEGDDTINAGFWGEDMMEMDLLDADLSYLLSLQPGSEGSSLDTTAADDGRSSMNLELTPFGSFDTFDSSSFNDIAFMDSMFSASGSPFAFVDRPWEAGRSERGDCMLFDMNLDNEPQTLSRSAGGFNPFDSKHNSNPGSFVDLQSKPRNSTPLSTKPVISMQRVSEGCKSDISVPSPERELVNPPNSVESSLIRQRRPKKTDRPLKSAENKWIFITDRANSERPRERAGIRRGQLPTKTRKKARRIREIGACWKCWVQKVPCSEGVVCETCVKHFSALAPQMCCRTRLHEYVPVFFPDYLHSHFDKRKMDDLITANSHGFTDKVIDIAVSTGFVFKPLSIQTHVFRPKTWELTGHYQLVAEEGELPQLVERYSAPIGVMSLFRAEMKIQCRTHIEEMISNPEYAAQVTAGHRIAIPKTILAIAQKFDLATKESTMVHEALMLHAIHHFISSLLTLTDESKIKVLRQIEHIGAPRGEYMTSRLLNRQIKYVMHLLHRELYQSVLEGLEKSLKSNTKKDSWGASFCTLLLLCLCIEELQTAADTFVLSDIRKDGLLSAYTRRDSSDACTTLEEYPFQQCMRLFHDVYRSRREGKAGGSSKDNGLNPLRDMASGKQVVVLDGPTASMVKDVYDLIRNSQEDIAELIARPTMIKEEFEDLKAIKAHNAGRVAASFLHSFVDSPEFL